MSGIKLPSRYEDLNESFRGRLTPNPELLALINAAKKSMEINGGIRFLPIFGESGSGKSCAARELGTHLPGCRIFMLNHTEIASRDALLARIEEEILADGHDPLPIGVVDQHEEIVATKEDLPTRFIEQLSLLDRGELRSKPALFIWLTTSKDFQASLADATSRNTRLLLKRDFEIRGPIKEDWPTIIDETFSFHNNGELLSDYQIIKEDVVEIARVAPTIGNSIEQVSDRLSHHLGDMENLSEYQVIMLWPVSDGLRIQRILQFTKPRDGYQLNWDAWYSELNGDDRRQLPLRDYNRTRLYFDVRLIPIAVADLHPLCRNLDDEEFVLQRTYLERLANTHFVSILKDTWNPDSYAPLRERASQRATAARDWYEGVTNQPTKLGRRLSKALVQLGLEASYETELTSSHGAVRADVFVKRQQERQNKVVIEIKAFSSDKAMPSAIRDAIRTTLKRHAQFAGFIQRQ